MAVGPDAAPHRPQLEGKVKRSKRQRPIALLRREPAVGTVCSLAGWGGRRGLKAALQELEVAVLDTRMCNNSRFWNGDLTPSMICFEGRGRGEAPTRVRRWVGVRGASCGAVLPRARLCRHRRSHRVTPGAPWCAGARRRWRA